MYLYVVCSFTLIIGLIVKRYLFYRSGNSSSVKIINSLHFLSFIRESSRKPLHELYEELYFKYGRLVSFHFLGKPMSYVVGDLDLAKVILVEKFSKFMDRLTLAKTGDEVFDRNLIFMGHESWKHYRKVVTPVFTMSKIRQIIPQMMSVLQNMTETFQELAVSGETCDVRKLFDDVSLDMISLMAFGVQVNSGKDKNNPVVRNIKNLFRHFNTGRYLCAMYIPWFMRLFSIRILPENPCNFLRKVLNREIAARIKQSEKSQMKDLLSLVIKALPPSEDPGEDACSLEVLSLCVVFLMAGYETTAAALSCAAHCLAFHSEHQETVAREVQQALQQHGQISVEVVDKLPFLSAVVSETLRLYPSVPVLNRTATEDVELQSGLYLKKGQTVVIPVSAIHRDPEYFPDPNTFDPNRFLSYEGNQHTFLPFGAGPRNCAGQQFALLETKMVLATAIATFRFVPVSESQKTVKMRLNSPLMFPEDIFLRIEKRSAPST